MSGSATRRQLEYRPRSKRMRTVPALVTATLIVRCCPADMRSVLTGVVGHGDRLTRNELIEPSTGRPLPPEVDVVTIEPGLRARVTEGAQVAFTVRATPAPTTDVVVTVSVRRRPAHMLAAGPGTVTVTIGTSGSAPLRLSTVPDTTDEPNSTVTATITGVTDATDTYTSSSRNRVARVTVADDDGSGGSDPPQTLVVWLVSATPSPVTEGQTLTRCR